VCVPFDPLYIDEFEPRLVPVVYTCTHSFDGNDNLFRIDISCEYVCMVCMRVCVCGVQTVDTLFNEFNTSTVADSSSKPRIKGTVCLLFTLTF